MRQFIIFQAIFIGVGALALIRGGRLRRKGAPRFAAERGKGLMIQGAAMLALAVFPGYLTLAAFVILHPIGMVIERAYRPRMTVGKVLRSIFNGERLAMIPPTNEQVQLRKEKVMTDALKSLETGAAVGTLVGLAVLGAILASPDLSMPPWPQVFGYYGLGVLGVGYLIFWLDLT